MQGSWPPQHRVWGRSDPPMIRSAAPSAERPPEGAARILPGAGLRQAGRGARRAAGRRGACGAGRGRAGAALGAAAAGRAGRRREPSRDCRAGRAGDTAPGPRLAGPGAGTAPGRPDMEVVDETEALQRFFW